MDSYQRVDERREIQSFIGDVCLVQNGGNSSESHTSPSENSATSS